MSKTYQLHKENPYVTMETCDKIIENIQISKPHCRKYYMELVPEIAEIIEKRFILMGSGEGLKSGQYENFE
jgi:hypothetical protein